MLRWREGAQFEFAFLLLQVPFFTALLYLFFNSQQLSKSLLLEEAVNSGAGTEIMLISEYFGSKEKWEDFAKISFLLCHIGGAFSPDSTLRLI